MSKVVLTEKAKWYLAKCFDGLDEFERYQEAIKELERQANKQFKEKGKVLFAVYNKDEDNVFYPPEQEWHRYDVGVFRIGDYFTALRKAFILVD